MKNFCILSDFDGTITSKDGLYTFIENYAQGDWQTIEQNWAEGKIDSKECLIEEFKLIPDLSKELIDNFIETLCIDKYFNDFYSFINKKNIDFYIVSDGIDYFIERILNKYGLKNLNIISNHGQFVNNNFEITFPNESKNCLNNSGTCKCNILNNLRNKYQKIYYIGDGVSDYCVANKADFLFAKSRLQKYCKQKNINHLEYIDFNDVLQYFKDIFKTNKH